MKHILDADLERYYLGLIQKDGLEEAELEEHLLWCTGCNERANEAADYVDAIRAGAVLEGFDPNTRGN